MDEFMCRLELHVDDKNADDAFLRIGDHSSVYFLTPRTARELKSMLNEYLEGCEKKDEE